MLDLPDLRQKSDHDCGQTVARVIYQYYEMRGVRPQGTPIDGTDPRSLEASFWGAGLRVQSGAMTPTDLRHHTRLGRPVACLVTEVDGSGHWLVVRGVQRSRVYYHCPVDGPRSEPVVTFEARWHDSDRVAVRYPQWGIAVWPGE